VLQNLADDGAPRAATPAGLEPEAWECEAGRNCDAGPQKTGNPQERAWGPWQAAPPGAYSILGDSSGGDSDINSGTDEIPGLWLPREQNGAA